MGYSAPLCALVAAILCLPIAMLRRTTREGITWRAIPDALEEGAKNTLAVAVACAVAGIVIGSTTITGLGISFSQVGVAMSHWHVSLLAFASATLGIIALAASFHGYLLAVLAMWQRVILFVAALCLIAPERFSSLVGLALLGAVGVSQLVSRRRLAATGAGPRAK